MRPFILFLLLLLLPASLVLSQNRPDFLNDEVSYFWPTNASRYMSSSFAETRSAHFHAAMDIGTWGHEGYPVFAARDGVVYRVGVGPRGYGNVVYLKHNDESISLYAHLKDFHPRIRHIVDSIRMRDYSFDFDKVLEEYAITFRKGEQIGWSGSTGVGPPHLHFELRSPEGRPFNPLLAGITIDDTIPPRFSGLALEPLSIDSEIEGSQGIKRVRPAYKNGWYDFGHHYIHGEIGVAVNVFDRANGSNNVHAVYELEMFVDDERYFQSRVDSFSFSQNRQMFLDRVFPILQSERKGYQRLYVRKGNQLPFYEDTGHSGRLKLPPGRHDVKIYASDFFGNRSRARLVLEWDTSRTDGPETIADFPDGYIRYQYGSGKGTGAVSYATDYGLSGVMASSGTNIQDSNRNYGSGFSYSSIPAIPDHLYWNKNWVRLKNTDTDYSSEKSDSNCARHSQTISVRSLGSFAAESNIIRNNTVPTNTGDRMTLTAGEKSWKLHRIHPDYPVTIYDDNMRISAGFPKGAFFESVTVGLSTSYPGFAIFPESEPFRRPAAIRIHLDEVWRNVPGLGLYKINASNGNSNHIASITDTEQTKLLAWINSGGKYILKADSIPPSVSSPEIDKWSHSDAFYATIAVDDRKSGINYQSAVFKVNDQRGIAEYDPEKKLLRFHLPGFRPETENEFYIRISDNAGNTTEQTFSGVRYN